MKNDNLKGQHRINEQIRAKEVRIVGDDIESAVYPLAQALKMAEEHEADLVEISPNAVPPVCRIIDDHRLTNMIITLNLSMRLVSCRMEIR